MQVIWYMKIQRDARIVSCYLMEIKDHTEEIKQLNDQEAKIDLIISELEVLEKFDTTDGKNSSPIGVSGEVQFLRSNPKFYIKFA